MSSPSPAGVPALPPLQIGPDSPSNTDNIEFDASVHHPFDEEKEQQEDQDEGGTAMAVAEPGYNERGREALADKELLDSNSYNISGDVSGRSATMGSQDALWSCVFD